MNNEHKKVEDEVSKISSRDKKTNLDVIREIVRNKEERPRFLDKVYINVETAKAILNYYRLLRGNEREKYRKLIEKNIDKARAEAFLKSAIED